MGRTADMKIEAFREAVLADARREARQRLDEAKRDAETRLQEARKRAEAQVEEARREGRQAAERETRRQRSEARRQAREVILRERRRALERLRERAIERAREEDANAYAALMERLERVARRQLGDPVEIESDRAVGGLVARGDGRRVDYRLPILVDRAMDDMGSELEDLWR